MTDHGHDVTHQYTKVMEQGGAEIEAQLDKATVQAVKDQIECGIDTPTDGEQRQQQFKIRTYISSAPNTKKPR